MTIRVQDMNDSVPVFTKDEWITEVMETTGDVIPSAPVLTVAVRDADESNSFVYSVIWANNTTYNLQYKIIPKLKLQNLYI